jgi:hypothetical protein
MNNCACMEYKDFESSKRREVTQELRIKFIQLLKQGPAMNVTDR